MQCVSGRKDTATIVKTNVSRRYIYIQYVQQAATNVDDNVTTMTTVNLMHFTWL